MFPFYPTQDEICIFSHNPHQTSRDGKDLCRKWKIVFPDAVQSKLECFKGGKKTGRVSWLET